jgi:hypothetical protein
LPKQDHTTKVSPPSGTAPAAAPATAPADPFPHLAALSPTTSLQQGVPAGDVSVSSFDGRELTCTKIGNSLLLHQASPEPGVSALRITFLAGTRIETSAERGLCHALEHVYLQEILDGPLREILRPGNIGRYSLQSENLSGETTSDRVTFSWWGPENFLPAAVEAFSKTLLKGGAPSQRALELESIKIRTEATIRTCNAHVLVARDLQDVFAPGSTEFTNIAGRAKDLANIVTVDTIQAMLRDRLLPSGVCISMVGGSKDLLASMGPALQIAASSALVPQNTVASSTLAAHSEPLPVFYRQTTGPMASVGLAFPDLSPADPRGHYAIFLRQALISFLELPLTPLTYEPIAPLLSHSSCGGFQGGRISCLPEVVPQILTTVREVAKLLGTTLVPENYFSGLRLTFLKRNVQDPSLSASGAAHFAEERALGRIGLHDFSALAEYVKQMSREELRKFAREVLSPSRLVLVIHSPTFEVPKTESSRILGQQS